MQVLNNNSLTAADFLFDSDANAGGGGSTGGLDPRFDISNYIVLPGDSGANSIFGGSDPEWIDGGEGNDTLRGGGGDDYIIAGPGSNDWNIFGDGGNDIFQYSDGDGQIHVKDFVSGEDKIYVTGVSGFADLDLEVPSWNPTLTRVRIIGGQSGNYVQVLNNNSLTAADFLFDSDANAGGGNPGSGSTGGIVWQVSYRPFGEVHVETGDAIDLRFPGQWYQAESGLHQNWMRDYDPTTGRYLQPDPLGLVDGPSLYGYAMQNPGRYVDPRGEQIVVPGGFGGLGPAAGVAPGTKLGDALGNSLADLVQSIIPESSLPKSIPETDGGANCPDPCDEARKRLKKAKENAKGRSCRKKGLSYTQYRRNRDAFRELLFARANRDNACHGLEGGPDTGHGMAQQQARNAMLKCEQQMGMR